MLQITPERSGIWRLRSTISKTATRSKDNKLFIAPFDTGKTYSSEFIAVGVIVKSSRDNWRSGGYLSQEFKFTTGSGYATSNRAFYQTSDLLVNNVQILQLPLLSEDSYKLRYFPPTYFADVRLQIWEYQGIETNTLIEDLGSFLAETPPNQLVNLNAIEQKLDRVLAGQQRSVEADFTALEQKLDLLLECACTFKKPKSLPGKLFLLQTHGLL